MRLASFSVENRPTWGVVDRDGVIDVGSRLKARFPDIIAVIAAGPQGLDEVEEAAGRCERLKEAEFVWLPAVPAPGKILCVGHNYESHVKETGRSVPAHPSVFVRFTDTLAAHGQAILKPQDSDMLDFEGELAVIIGVGGRRIAASSALQHVAGYACFNDASVRDWQWHTPLVTSGKNFPQTGGFGPWLITSDEVEDPAKLEVVTRLNGVSVQHQPTADMIFDVGSIISYVSGFTALQTGDVICTGTPGGVGAKRQPPLWMKPGDVVEVDIPGVGRLLNPIASEG